jgi:hypothetical protein
MLVPAKQLVAQKEKNLKRGICNRENHQHVGQSESEIDRTHRAYGRRYLDCACDDFVAYDGCELFADGHGRIPGNKKARKSGLGRFVWVYRPKAVVWFVVVG